MQKDGCDQAPPFAAGKDSGKRSLPLDARPETDEQGDVEAAEERAAAAAGLELGHDHHQKPETVDQHEHRADRGDAGLNDSPHSGQTRSERPTSARQEGHILCLPLAERQRISRSTPASAIRLRRRFHFHCRRVPFRPTALSSLASVSIARSSGPSCSGSVTLSVP